MTAHRAVVRNLRGFSSSSSRSPAAEGSTPKWLDRWFQVWYEESGTHEILQLKEKVNLSSLAFDGKQREVVEARNMLEKALKAWEDSQTQHTQLLQVRDRWTPIQAQDFAQLVQKEVTVRNDLKEAKNMLAEREAQQSEAQIQYMNDLRRRYHEEQIWQDKWRVLSTFGTWGLIILNSFVFLISQYLYRMRESRRMKDIHALLQETLTSNTSTLQAIQEHQKQQSEAVSNESQKEFSKQRQDNDSSSSSVEASDGKPEVDSSTSQKEDSETNQSFLSTWKHRSADWATLQNQLVSAWQLIQQNALSMVEKQKLPEQVDVPSAILGASLTCLAWIVATTLSSRKGKQ